MVPQISQVLLDISYFQYSLCRVVLIPSGVTTTAVSMELLSVLALSSRFDG